jgi:hypothetical protein
MQKAATVVPEGFRENARGHLIPVDTIRQSDLVIDDFVTEASASWIVLQGLLRDFKIKLFGDVQALLDLIAEKYQVQRGGTKGNVQLFTYDGRFKLIVAVADSISFGPELQAAQQLVSDCLHSWTEHSGVELKTVVNAAFAVDATGKLNVGRILSLRRYAIDNEQWRQAMAAIGDAIMVVGSKQYMRLYQRNAVGAYIAIPLDIAAL